MPENQNSYDFILNSGGPPKKKSLLGFLPSPQNRTQRIILALAIGTILLFLMIIIFALVLGGGGNSKELNMSLAQRHAEIIRVANVGIERARGHDARNLAVTTKLSLQSSQTRLHGLMVGRVDSKQLAAGHDAATDTTLRAAEQSNRFDEVFMVELTLLLREYQAQLRAALTDASQSESKEVYHQILAQVSALLPDASDQ